MNLALAATRMTVRSAASVSPRWGAAAALPFFAYVQRPRPIRPDDQPTMWRARRGSVRIAGVDRRGVDVDTYEWGAGDRVVVLAHGWNGRASQFSALVRELVAEGYRVVAFDAPAHGTSGGRRTYLVDWLDVFAAIQERHGVFAATVGHSFGGLATLVAVAGGIRSAKVVTIAAPADADLLLRQFQGTVGYTDAVSAHLRELFADRYFPAERDPFARLSSVRRPMGSDVSLLVAHDETDRMVPYGEAARIMAAHPAARLLTTTGLGHSRILAADVMLDAVLEHVAAAPAVRVPVDDARARTAAAPVVDGSRPASETVISALP